jgi:hypothetical protein
VAFYTSRDCFDVGEIGRRADDDAELRRARSTQRIAELVARPRCRFAPLGDNRFAVDDRRRPFPWLVGERVRLFDAAAPWRYVGSATLLERDARTVTLSSVETDS